MNIHRPSNEIDDNVAREMLTESASGDPLLENIMHNLYACHRELGLSVHHALINTLSARIGAPRPFALPDDPQVQS